MTEKDKDNKAAAADAQPQPEGTSAAKTHRSPALAWIALAITVLAWVVLMTVNGYVALAVAAVGVVAGFFAMPGRSRGARNLAITAIIAAMVLIVVLSAFLIVIKVGLQGGAPS